jgi:hypothetical protein
MTGIHWTPVSTVRPRRPWGVSAPSNGHTAQVLHVDYGGRYTDSYNWSCSCGGQGQPEQTCRAARRGAQKHVNHPEQP